jgi:hypothetical protein
MKLKSFYAPYKRFLPTEELDRRWLVRVVWLLRWLRLRRAAIAFVSRYEPVTDLPPRLPAMLGDCHAALGQPREAAARYAQALCGAWSPRAFHGLRQAVGQLARDERHGDALRTALPRIRRGFKHFLAGRFAEAASAFAAARRVAPFLEVAQTLERQALERERFADRFCE